MTMANNYGIATANTTVTEDGDKGKRGGCHELHVVHHIRMRGRALVSSFDTAKKTRSELLRTDSTTSKTPRKGHEEEDVEILKDRNLGREVSFVEGSTEFPVRSPSSHASVSSLENEKRKDSVDSRADTDERSGSDITHDEESYQPAQCIGIWCWVRDLLLLYAVVGVTYLLTTILGHSDAPSQPSAAAYGYAP